MPPHGVYGRHQALHVDTVAPQDLGEKYVHLHESCEEGSPVRARGLMQAIGLRESASRPDVSTTLS